jgi:hypothetical protein
LPNSSHRHAAAISTDSLPEFRRNGKLTIQQIGLTRGS